MSPAVRFFLFFARHRLLPVFCASARGMYQTASALRSSFDFVPYCFYFVNVYKLDFLFRTLLKFVPLPGKRARIC